MQTCNQLSMVSSRRADRQCANIPCTQYLARSIYLARSTLHVHVLCTQYLHACRLCMQCVMLKPVILHTALPAVRTIKPERFVLGAGPRVKVALRHSYVYCACVDWYGTCTTFARYTLGEIVCTVTRSCSWSNG